MGKKTKTHRTPVAEHPRKCLVHKWRYHDAGGMRFRVCEKCDALEARMKIARPGVKWVSYAPKGGTGFINALQAQIERKSLAEENGIELDNIEVGSEEDVATSGSQELTENNK